MSYVKFEIPEKLKNQIKSALTAIAEARDSKIRKGMNEVTKSIERKLAKFIVMAEDVTPPEILFHVPDLCDEMGVPYGYISTKKELGNATKINIGASAVSIETLGSGNEGILNEILKQIEQLKK